MNFDEASKAWRVNKKSHGNGYFSYVCGHPTKKGVPCQNKRINNSNTCHIHNIHSQYTFTNPQ